LKFQASFDSGWVILHKYVDEEQYLVIAQADGAVKTVFHV